jgi:gluconolactonase
MDRRAFLAASAVTASGLAVRVAAAATEGPFGATAAPLPVVPTHRLPLGPLSTRYPDTHVEALDKHFKGSVGPGAVERVASGFRWAEGPTYFRAGHYLLFSDIPNNRMMRIIEDDGRLSVFRSPSMNSNGNTTDRQGREPRLRRPTTQSAVHVRQHVDLCRLCEHPRCGCTVSYQRSG